MKILSKALFLTGAMFFIFSNPVMANEGYFGVGIAKVEASIFGIDAGDANGFKIFGGSRSGAIGWEVTYQDFGDVDGGAFGGIDGTGDTLNFSMLGYLSAGQSFDLFGKISLLNWDVEILGLSDSGTDIGFGFGGQFNTGNNMSVRVEYEIYEGLDWYGADLDLDLFSVSAVFRF